MPLSDGRRRAPRSRSLRSAWTRSGLGRRHKNEHKFVTIISNLATGEPIWIGEGRDEAAVRPWLDGLTPEQKAGIRVFAVGIGSETGEPIPLHDRRGQMVGYKRDSSGATVLTRLDRAGLARLAEATDGQMFHQPQQVAMAEVVKQIDQLQKSEFESRLMVHYDQHFQYYALPGLALVLTGMLIRPSRRRRTA